MLAAKAVNMGRDCSGGGGWIADANWRREPK